MKVKTLLISSASFVIAFGIGLGGALVLRDYMGKSGSSQEIPSFSPQETQTDECPAPESPSGTVPEPNAPEHRLSGNTTPVITEVEGPEFHVRKRTYSVRVHTETKSGETANVEYTLYDDTGTVVSSGASPDFTVPQSESGVYYVRVTDKATGETSSPFEIKGCRIRKMSAKRLEQICNSGDYTTMRNVEAYELAPDLTLHFTGIADDQEASSIDDICTRISLGIWKSVAVLDVQYDELNLVESVKFQVHL